MKAPRESSKEAPAQWLVYYILKLALSLQPRSILLPWDVQERVGKALTCYADEEDLTPLDAARIVYAHLSEGLSTDATARFLCIYHDTLLSSKA